jgi:hypothetical protein
MSARRTARHGDGTVWLVADRLIGDYLCYWYAGTNDGHLVDCTRLATASDAVAWGRLRTSRVRIRTADACTRWAGTAPRPAGFNHTWTDPDPTTVPQPSSVHVAGPASPPRPTNRTIEVVPAHPPGTTSRPSPRTRERRPAWGTQCQEARRAEVRVVRVADRGHGPRA